MPKKTKQTLEQKRELDRLQKQKKYAELKKDPEKYAEVKAKERARYLKRKENKKIKSAEDMTPRQLRNRRKMWRVNLKRHYENKKNEKAIQQLLINNSPPSSDTEALPAEQDPLARRASSQEEVNTEQFQSFIDDNTTPEFIQEINDTDFAITPSNPLISSKNYSSHRPHSPFVKILSDINMTDWDNRKFCVHKKNLAKLKTDNNKTYHTDFEKFIMLYKDENEDDTKKTKDEVNEEDEEKKNKTFYNDSSDTSDDDLKIF